MMVLFSQPRGNRPPAGKRADVVLQFTDAEGPLLHGIELHGLAVWERRDGSGLFVSLPGREYEAAGGQKKTFDFLRYTTDGDKAQLESLKTQILAQYVDWSGGR